MELLGEIWKDVEDYSGYQVSSLGRVRTLDRMVKHCMGSQRKIKGRIIKLAKRNGYNFCNMSKDGKKHNVITSRIIAFTFIPNPENKPEVNHINGIKTDNRVENLEWATPSENMKHAFKTGLNKVSSKRIKSLIELNELRGKLVLDLQMGIFYDSMTKAAYAKQIPIHRLKQHLFKKSENKTGLILI